MTTRTKVNGPTATRIIRKPSTTIAIAREIVPDLTDDQFQAIREERAALVGSWRAGLRFRDWLEEGGVS